MKILLRQGYATRAGGSPGIALATTGQDGGQRYKKKEMNEQVWI